MIQKACSQITPALVATNVNRALASVGIAPDAFILACDEVNFVVGCRDRSGYIYGITAPDDVAIVWDDYGRPDIYDHAAAEAWEKGNVNPC